MRWHELSVVVTGGAGFLGRSVCEALRRRGAARLFVPRRSEHDLTREEDVRRLYREHRPDILVHLAAEVGGIGANQARPGRFFHANMAMGLHLIEQGRAAGIQKLVHVGTACSYPADTPVPFTEDWLFRGAPEPTNAPYGIAKRALIVMLDAYHREYGLRSAVVIPANLYGPGDHFDLKTSHVVPAMIRRFHEAARDHLSSVTCWGSGAASREFLYVDDAAEGILRAAEVMEEPAPLNLGTGVEVTIRELAERIAELSGYEGRIEWDRSKPDGQRRRSLDPRAAEARLGWQATVPLREGLRRTIDWYRSTHAVEGPG